MSHDAMVPIAVLFSRSEALTVAAMLDAAGIIVHVGGEYFGGTTLNVVAMGGYRLTVPDWQHRDAATVLEEFSAQSTGFIADLRRRTLRILAIVGITVSLPGAILYIYSGGGLVGAIVALLLPLSTTPTSPQARGDYYLSVAASD